MSAWSKPEELEHVADWLSGVSHPTRVQILEALRQTEKLSPKQLSEVVEPRVSLGTISHHTRELAALGLVARAGTRPVRGALQHFYSLSPHGRELLGLVDRLVVYSNRAG